jgi:dolichol-phosphate mannosyltransferase
MASNSDSLAVIIPAFNEEAGLERCILEVMTALNSLTIRASFIMVNDGSTDKTNAIIQANERKYPKFLGISHLKNQGYGAALRSGIKTAEEKGLTWCLFMDSDLTNDPKHIQDFVQNMSPKIDCVRASRYIQNGQVVGVPISRRWISRIGNLVASTLFGLKIKDCTNGFRMVRTELLKSIPYQETGFTIIVEELYYLKKLQAKIKEIPYTLTSRVDTKTHFYYTAPVFLKYLKYAVKAAIL